MSDASVPLGRIQWSKVGITLYDINGAFVCRLEDVRDRNFLAAMIGEALRKISYEQSRRSTFVADAPPPELESDMAAPI